MGLYSALKTSAELETKGIWLQFENTRIKLARAGGGNAKYVSAMEKLARENKRVFELNVMSSEQGKRLMYNLYAETVVLDWLTQDSNGALEEDGTIAADNTPPSARWSRGIESPDSATLLDFNRGNVISTFGALEELFVIVKDTAESVNGYKAALVEDIVKN